MVSRSAQRRKPVPARPSDGRATHIGDFGSVHEDVELTFGYFGATIRVNPEASDLEFIEFIQSADSIDEMDELESSKAMLRYVRQQIHPDDWDLFWSLSKRNRQNTADLMVTSQSILAAVAGFHTGPSSDSSRGRRPTPQRSQGDSSSAGRGQKSSVQRALDQVVGRPDLQLVVTRSQEAREADSQAG